MRIIGQLTRKDRQALLIYLGIAALCAFFFAIGILITCVMPRSSAADGASAASFTVRVLGVGSAGVAEQLRAALGAQLKVPAVIEEAAAQAGDPEGYVVKVGPFATREAADDLAVELRQAGYGGLQIVAGQ